jgi:hypothetical protein
VWGDEQADTGTSLDAQTRECRWYVAERGWVLGGELSDVLTGRRTDRPDYQRLPQRVRDLRAERRAVVVVVAALDPFGRRVLERVRCREELKNWEWPRTPSAKHVDWGLGEERGVPSWLLKPESQEAVHEEVRRMLSIVAKPPVLRRRLHVSGGTQGTVAFVADA